MNNILKICNKSLQHFSTIMKNNNTNRNNSPDLASRACQTLSIFSFRSSKFVCQHLSLLICLRGPRRHQILLPSQLRCSSGEAGPMSVTPPGDFVSCFWTSFFVFLLICLSFLFQIKPSEAFKRFVLVR